MGPIRFTVRYFEEIVAGIFMTLMSLATFTNVLLRYLFNNPIQWAEEFSRYAFIWMVFMGAAACSKRGTHIIIDAVITSVPARVRLLCAVLTDLVVLTLMMAVTYYGWVLCSLATQATSTLKIPQYVVYLIVPISGALIFLHTLRRLWDDLHAGLLKGARS
jgi:TRAP-type C4-dicarboxylate transport system permease small subunit